MQVCEAAGRALADRELGFLMGSRPCSEVRYPWVCFDFNIFKNYIEFVLLFFRNKLGENKLNDWH